MAICRCEFIRTMWKNLLHNGLSKCVVNIPGK